MTMTSLDMWNLIVGFVLPNVIAVVQQPRWSDRVRALVTGAICVFAGIVTVVLSGGHLDFGRALVTSILTIGVAAVSFYKHFWKPIGVTPRVEKMTALQHPRHSKVS